MPQGFVELVRASLAKAYRERDLLLPPECKLGNGHHPRLLTIARSLENESNLEAAIRGFFADARTAAEGFPLPFLERNPNRYVLAGRPASQAAPGASETPSSPSGNWDPSKPRWLPGGPESVTPCATMEELVARLRDSTRVYLRDVEGVAEAQWPRELLDAGRHERTWHELGTWVCSQTYRLRRGNATTPAEPALQASKVWLAAVKGWLADPLALGDGSRFSLEVLVAEPERMWAEGRFVRRGAA